MIKSGNMLSVACRVLHQVVFRNSKLNIFYMRAFLKSHSAYARIWMHHFLRLILQFWNLLTSAQCYKVIRKLHKWGRETAIFNYTLVLMWVVQCQFRKLIVSKSSTWLNILVLSILFHCRHLTARKVSANRSSPVKKKTQTKQKPNTGHLVVE